MTCEELLQALSEYVDGTLDISSAECQRLTEHLAGCKPCQVVLDNIHKTIKLYRYGEPYPLPPEFEARLKEVLRHRWKVKFPTSSS